MNKAARPLHEPVNAAVQLPRPSLPTPAPTTPNPSKRPCLTCLRKHRKFPLLHGACDASARPRNLPSDGLDCACTCFHAHVPFVMSSGGGGGDMEEPSTSLRGLSLASRAGQRWREKLKDKASKLTAKAPERGATSHDDVSAFLRPESAQSSYSSHTGPPQPPPYSSPLASQRTSPAPPDNARPSPDRNRPPWKFRRKLPRGMHVNFTSQEPEIIGEGGDESEIPSKDVRGTWAGPGPTVPEAPKPKPAPPDALLAGGGPGGPRPTTQNSRISDEEAAKRMSLARNPTRKPVGGWHHKRRSMNMEEGLVQAQMGDRATNGPPNILGGDIEKSPVTSPSAGMGYAPLDAQWASMQSLQDDERPTSSRSDGQSSLLGGFKAYNPTMSGAAPSSAPAPSSYSSSARIQEDELSPATSYSSSARRETSAISSPRESLEDRRPRQSLDDRRSCDDAPEPQHSLASFMPKKQGSSTSYHPPSRDNHEHEHEHEHDPIPEGQEESEDFYARVQHLRGVFRLAAEKCQDIEAKEIEHWLRAAAWWFLRGKSTLEGNLRAAAAPRQKTPTKPDKTPAQNLQSYVNLAKAWWIVEDVLPDLLDPNRPFARHNARGPIDGLDFAQLFDMHQALSAALRTFALLLARRDALPPPALLVQGADPTIWLDAPPLPTGILVRTAGLDPRTLQRTAKQPFFPIPLTDTRRHFSYGRVFSEVDVPGGSPDGSTAPLLLPCAISIVRDRTSPQAELTLTSQDGQLNLHVQTDPRAGPTWRDVEWRVKERRMRIRLSSDLAITIRLWEQDFKTLWGIHDYLRRVEAERQPRDGERCVFEHILTNFHYVPPSGTAGPAPFPTAPVRQCLVRLFTKPASSGPGSSDAGVGGCRMTVVTPPALKTLSSLTRAYGRGAPVLYSNLRGDANAPALLLASREEGTGKRSSVVLTFADMAPRVELLGHLSGFAAGPDDAISPDVPVKQVSIMPMTPDAGGRELAIATRTQWQSLRVMGPAPESAGGVGGPRALLERSRICATCSYGTVTDMVRLRPGELRMSLDIVNTTMVKLYRPAQNNLLVSFADNLVPKEEVEGIYQTVQAVAVSPTARIYKFPTLSGMLSTSLDLLVLR